MLEFYDLLAVAIICGSVVAIFRIYMQARNPKAFREERSSGEDLMVGGLVMCGIGIALLIGIYFGLGNGLLITGALVALFMGIALLAGSFLRKK
jgi:hypothetical protein